MKKFFARQRKLVKYKMVNNSLEHAIEKYRYWIFFATTGFIALSTWITNPILDSNYLFHEGEYVGLLYGVRAFLSGDAQFPLLIHGVMDYIPAVIASFIYGDDYIIVGTRALNTIAVWITWVLFLDVGFLLISRTNQRIIWVTILIVIFLMMTPSLHAKALSVQQGFLGIRELFLISTVWCFTQYTFSPNPARRKILIITGGISAVMSIYWCYDRGIMAVAFLVVIFTGMIANRQKINAALLFLTICISLAAIQYLKILGSLGDHLHNIHYWVKYSKEVWGDEGGWSTIFTALSHYELMSLAVLLFCTATLVIAFLNRPNKSEKEIISLLIGFTLVQIAMLFPRLSWLYWPSILIMIYFISRKVSFDFNVTVSNPAVSKNSTYGYILYLFIFFIPFLVANPISGHASFVKNTFKPKPDTAIVSAEIIHLSTAIIKSDDQCIFGWVNEGVIALMAKKRFCTQYPNAVYVSSAEETQLLQQLRKESPSVIVFDVEGESFMTIRGRNMKDRLPVVNAFIGKNYPHKKQIGRYLIVSK